MAAVQQGTTTSQCAAATQLRLAKRAKASSGDARRSTSESHVVLSDQSLKFPSVPNKNQTPKIFKTKKTKTFSNCPYVHTWQCGPPASANSSRKGRRPDPDAEVEAVEAAEVKEPLTSSRSWAEDVWPQKGPWSEKNRLVWMLQKEWLEKLFLSCSLVGISKRC